MDGVVLVGDMKMTQTDSGGIHDVYDNKITGELDGILTGFSGDAGAFEVFRDTLRDYVTRSRTQEMGPVFEQFKLRVSQIQSEFYTKYQKFQYKVLMGVSAKYFPNKKSALYQYETDGRCFPLKATKAIGSGSSHVFYFLKRY